MCLGAGGFRDGMAGHRRPRRLRPRGHQRGRDVADQRDLWAGCGDGEADARGRFDDAGAKLQQPQADGGELGGGERMGAAPQLSIKCTVTVTP